MIMIKDTKSEYINKTYIFKQLYLWYEIYGSVKFKEEAQHEVEGELMEIFEYIPVYTTFSSK